MNFLTYFTGGGIIGVGVTSGMCIGSFGTERILEYRLK